MDGSQPMMDNKRINMNMMRTEWRGSMLQLWMLYISQAQIYENSLPKHTLTVSY